LPHHAFPVVPERARPAVGGHVIEFGKRYHQVVDGLRLTCRELAVEISGFAELSIEDVARELEVAMVDARLAKLREYTELFRIIDETDPMRSRLFKALRRRGLRCWRIGTHHLVTATPDRAEGPQMLRAMWAEAWGDPLMVGLGDSEDDVAWPRHMDVAIIVQNPRTVVPARMLAKLPTLHVTRWPGRHGWSEAVFEFVGGLVTPRADADAPCGSAKRGEAGSENQPP
jgi:mannosyl-3-phosphoglycerate phosphatase